MLYKCEHCDYASKRLPNLIRHQNRLYPCNMKKKVTSNNSEDTQNVTSTQHNIHDSQHNIHDSQQNVSDIQRNVNDIQRNVNVSKTSTFQCSKCKKTLSSKQRLQQHEASCDGLDPKQCRICLKVFSTYQGKHQHMKYVTCSPPQVSNQTIHNVNNIDNRVDNSKTNNVQINIMRTDFDKISNEHIQHIVNQIKQSDYLQMITDNMDIGKYVIPRTMEHIYFNDMFPEMQTLKKERRNDKLVGVHVGNGKWEKRLIDDIFAKIIRRVEDFHTKYFKYVEEKYKHVEVGSPRWKQIMRPIKSMGNLLLWYDGFSGDQIESMGIQLNYPDEDDDEDVKSRERRNKEMEQLISEKVYDNTLSKEKTITL